MHLHSCLLMFMHMYTGLILYMYRYTCAYLYVPMGKYRCIYEYTDLKVKTY